jgi:tight adherence protein C
VADLMLALVAVFASVALLTGAAASAVLSRSSAGRRRLFALQVPHMPAAVAGGVLIDRPTARDSKLSTYVPKSPKEMTRLQKRLAEAGYHGYTPVLVYAFSEIGLAVIGFVTVASFVGLRRGALFAVAAAVQGYMVPGFVVARRIRRRKKDIENGLPDALDLLIVSLEAGLAIDQALLKSAEELEIAYPALSQELHLVNIEVRAGKPRLEALKNFAKRTKVDDVRALVAMLVQTDRFGTSVAQALRTHAEVARLKRRQRAEEKAAKLSVKLIFPLVFCLLPAFFVISVGPAIIKFVEFFGNMDLGGLP